MNNQLAIIFVPDSELNSWAQPIQARPTSHRRRTTVADSAAALRITPTRCRYARRRFFSPGHTFEHRLP